MQGALESRGSRAVLQLDAAPGAAVLVMRGGQGRSLPPDARSLLLRLAAVCGGAVVQSGGAGPFAAALRLPLHGEMPRARRTHSRRTAAGPLQRPAGISARFLHRAQ